MAEILALTDGHPVVRGVGGARRGPAWRHGDTVAFVGLDAEIRVRVLVALGPPDEAAELIQAVRGELPPTIEVSAPRGAPLAFVEPVNWNFRATSEPPPPQAAESGVSWVDDEVSVRDLLKLTSPGSSAWPGDPKVRRWAGVRNGSLLACLADTTSIAGVGHLSAIATHPDARGQGLGSAVTAWATRRLLAEDCDIVTLGVYAENAVAARLYDRLGFTLDQPFTSGVLAP